MRDRSNISHKDVTFVTSCGNEMWRATLLAALPDKGPFAIKLLAPGALGDQEGEDLCLPLRPFSEATASRCSPLGPGRARGLTRIGGLP